MPVVQIQMFEGRTIDQKRAMVRKVTDAICESIGCPADAVLIIVNDMKKHDYAEAGVLYADQ
jgi:4-oxalocrotonate tautomerase